MTFCNFLNWVFVNQIFQRGGKGVRNMKLNEKAFANASAVFTVVLYIVCGLFVAIFPSLTKTITQSWFHGIDLELVWSASPFPGNFLLGLVSAAFGMWIAGWGFAWLYNRLLKGK